MMNQKRGLTDSVSKVLFVGTRYFTTASASIQNTPAVHTAIYYY